MNPTTCIVTPWHNPDQCRLFLEAWHLTGDEPFLVLQRDTDAEGCAVTKNRGIRAAVERGAEIVVVLDDDCYPSVEATTAQELMTLHASALTPQPFPLFSRVSDPPSRGTPYHTRTVERPVAASMGFWLGVGDYDAPGQLVHGPTHRMQFRRRLIGDRYFALSGMNLAFRPIEWLPWCQFIDVPRFDDIWMGWLWQREAYRRGHCFNLQGPLVHHSRQSNVWTNLRDEAEFLETNETLWREIATHPGDDYDTLRSLLPV
jgi:hypothetical protein